MIAFNSPQMTGNPVDAAVGTSASVVCSTDDKGDALGLWTAWLAESGPEVVHPKRYVRWQRAVDAGRLSPGGWGWQWCRGGHSAGSLARSTWLNQYGDRGRDRARRGRLGGDVHVRVASDLIGGWY